MATDEERIRGRLRGLREERGLSLDEVAAAAGMSPSTLSRLETGKRRLAVDHLAPLARALGVSVDELLAPAPRADPRVRGRARTVDGVRVVPLSAGGGSGPRAYHLTIPERGAPDMREHEGHEWLYVLRGRLRLVLGDDDLVLEPGEAAEFSTWTPHWLSGAGGPAEVLVLMGHHGERAHLRVGATAAGSKPAPAAGPACPPGPAGVPPRGGWKEAAPDDDAVDPGGRPIDPVIEILRR